MIKKWYALRVASGQENKISQLIKVKSSNGEFTDPIGETYIPTHNVIVTRKGKRYTQKKRLIPGYILVEIEMPETEWRDIVFELRSIDGVIGFASVTGAKQRPQALTEEEVRNMLQYGRESATVVAARTGQQFSKGDKVSIQSGPFNSFVGIVEEVDTKRAHLVVSVEIFGRATPIEIEFNQVEKV